MGQAQLNRLSKVGYLPPSERASTHFALVTKDGASWSMRVPQPRSIKRVCFISHIVRGFGFPIHPFLQGLLHFYGLQLHHLVPNSILHIACFIIFCEAFLCCEPHFGLWCKYFNMKLQTRGPETCECSSAYIGKILGSGYLDGTLIETNKNWQEEWFYISDVSLENPPRAGIITPFTLTPLTKLNSWRPRSSPSAYSEEVTNLRKKVARWVKDKLTLVQVTHVALSRGIQPLQA